ncbi:hypothetical protein BZA77DRAFT_29761 [Pyronema omphalodes]|nr:hypothetical protein BZA77DRAFT_29761 [Pyronema omphalodes]
MRTPREITTALLPILCYVLFLASTTVDATALTPQDVRYRGIRDGQVQDGDLARRQNGPGPGLTITQVYSYGNPVATTTLSTVLLTEIAISTTYTKMVRPVSNNTIPAVTSTRTLTSTVTVPAPTAKTVKRRQAPTIQTAAPWTTTVTRLSKFDYTVTKTVYTETVNVSRTYTHTITETPDPSSYAIIDGPVMQITWALITVTAKPERQTENKTKGGANGGVIAGGVIGGVAAVGILIGVIVMLRKRSRRKVNKNREKRDTHGVTYGYYSGPYYGGNSGYTALGHSGKEANAEDRLRGRSESSGLMIGVDAPITPGMFNPPPPVTPGTPPVGYGSGGPASHHSHPLHPPPPTTTPRIPDTPVVIPPSEAAQSLRSVSNTTTVSNSIPIPFQASTGYHAYAQLSPQISASSSQATKPDSFRNNIAPPPLHHYERSATIKEGSPSLGPINQVPMASSFLNDVTEEANRRTAEVVSPLSPDIPNTSGTWGRVEQKIPRKPAPTSTFTSPNVTAKEWS